MIKKSGEQRKNEFLLTRISAVEKRAIVVLAILQYRLKENNFEILGVWFEVEKRNEKINSFLMLTRDLYLIYSC